MNNPKYIIRELPPDRADLGFWFDGDMYSEASGDYFNTLFIINDDGCGRLSGLNIEEYKNVQRRARDIIEDFEYTKEHIENGDRDRNGKRPTYKEVMELYCIEYNPAKCHALKEWAESGDENEPEDIAAFLTITTGKKWDVTGVTGYCQGDYVELVYCPERYREGVQAEGEVWLGCAREFGVIELDENGEEGDAVYGYIVPDCMGWRDEDYKRIVSEWACIEENEAVLEMFDGYAQTATWRTA